MQLCGLSSADRLAFSYKVNKCGRKTCRMLPHGTLQPAVPLLSTARIRNIAPEDAGATDFLACPVLAITCTAQQKHVPCATCAA